MPSLTLHIFLSLTTAYSSLKPLNPPCVCVNSELRDKCYTKMKTGVELLVFIYFIIIIIIIIIISISISIILILKTGLYL